MSLPEPPSDVFDADELILDRGLVADSCSESEIAPSIPAAVGRVVGDGVDAVVALEHIITCTTSIEQVVAVPPSSVVVVSTAAEQPVVALALPTSRLHRPEAPSSASLPAKPGSRTSSPAESAEQVIPGGAVRRVVAFGAADRLVEKGLRIAMGVEVVGGDAQLVRLDDRDALVGPVAVDQIRTSERHESRLPPSSNRLHYNGRRTAMLMK